MTHTSQPHPGHRGQRSSGLPASRQTYRGVPPLTCRRVSPGPLAPAPQNMGTEFTHRRADADQNQLQAQSARSELRRSQQERRPTHDTNRARSLQPVLPRQPVVAPAAGSRPPLYQSAGGAGCPANPRQRAVRLTNHGASSLSKHLRLRPVLPPSRNAQRTAGSDVQTDAALA